MLQDLLYHLPLTLLLLHTPPLIPKMKLPLAVQLSLEMHHLPSFARQTVLLVVTLQMGLAWIHIAIQHVTKVEFAGKNVLLLPEPPHLWILPPALPFAESTAMMTDAMMCILAPTELALQTQMLLEHKTPPSPLTL